MSCTTFYLFLTTFNSILGDPCDLYSPTALRIILGTKLRYTAREHSSLRSSKTLMETGHHNMLSVSDDERGKQNSETIRQLFQISLKQYVGLR